MYMYKYTKIPHHKRYINGKKYYKRLKTRELKKKKMKPDKMCSTNTVRLIRNLEQKKVGTSQRCETSTTHIYKTNGSIIII